MTRNKRAEQGATSLISQPLLVRVLKAISRSGPLRIAKRWIITSRYVLGVPKRLAWSFGKTEDSNFYYPLTPINESHLASFVANICSSDSPTVESLFAELRNNETFLSSVEEFRQKNASVRDSSFEPGRRLGWYAFIRLLKPRFVLETGVHHGLGALVSILALEANRDEGFDGEYLGTDIHPSAGGLASGLFSNKYRLAYGDSITSISTITDRVDLYISDSDHSSGYERRELDAVAGKLSNQALVLADNAHATNVLKNWSEENGRKFLFFAERPSNHIYPGAGIGASWISNP